MGVSEPHAAGSSGETQSCVIFKDKCVSQVVMSRGAENRIRGQRKEKIMMNNMHIEVTSDYNLALYCECCFSVTGS